MSQPSNGRRAIPEQRPETGDGDDVPWARQASTQKPATTRARRIVRDLPGWDPLPPGESLVQRRPRD